MSLSLPHNQADRSTIWRWLFLLSALEGFAALIFVANLPSDAENSRLLGYSTSRLLLMALLLCLALAAGMLARRVWRGASAGWLNPALHRRRWAALFVLLPLIALFSLLAPLVLFSLYRTTGLFLYLAYYERLLPLFIWLALTSLQFFGGVAWAGGFCWSALNEQRAIFRSGLLAYAGFGLAALFVIVTGIGLHADVIGWGLPTVALLEWQIWLAWALGTAFLLWCALRGWSHRADLLLAAAIWLLAAGVWLSQPVRPAFFATAGRAPNEEIYPFSDGVYYGTFAQSLLIGNGFKGDQIPARPFYITLLAGFHALAGQQYEHVIALQTLFLALFPVILFFLGRELHSRPAGLMMALLAILRELTAVIAMPFTDNASNSKLFFADLPTALMLCLWLLLVVIWLKAPARRPLMPLVIGGGMGVVMLFRTQSMFLLPSVLLVALIMLRFRWRAWLRAAALLGLGLALAVVPWLARNWASQGQFAFDDARSQSGSMAARYTLGGNDMSYAYQPGEDQKAYSQRVNQGIFNFLFAHPDIVAGFVTAHFFNAEIANAMVLPIRSGLSGPGELMMPTTAFWEFWQGSLSPAQAVLFFLNLGLLALGVGACWARLGWVGLVPLLANLSYNFSMSLARNSGGRYLLAVDWVTYLYAAVGLVEIAVAVLTVVGLPTQRINAQLVQRAALSVWEPRPSKPLWQVGLGIGLVLLLLGSLPPLAEKIAPARYPAESQESLMREVLQGSAQHPTLAGSRLDAQALQRFLAQPGALIFKGRALYPRYYDPGEGEPRTAKIGYRPLPYGRTVFQVTAPRFNGVAVLKAAQVPPFFPNASDVLLVGCAFGNAMEPALVVILDPPGGVYLADSGLPAQCGKLEVDQE